MESKGGVSPGFLAGKSVLIVEDEGDIRDHLVKTMGNFGATVNAVTNGKAAIEFLRANHCDFVISDLLMGGGGGLALIKDIQKFLIKKPKVFVYSAYVAQNDKELLQSTGFVAGIFEKPFRSEHLAAAIAKELNVTA